MTAPRSSRQINRDALPKSPASRQLIINADAWRDVRVSSRSVRRASAKLQEFDAELRQAIAARNTESQQIRQESQKSLAELQAGAQVIAAQPSQLIGSFCHHQEPVVSVGVEKLEAFVAEHVGSVSETDQAAVQHLQPLPREPQRQVESAQTSNDPFQATSPSHEFGGQSHPIQKTLRQSAWRVVPEWTGDRTSTSALNQASLPEQVVYRYLQTHGQGARLPELESNLGISRLETIDALRALIRRELVIQNNKTYCVYQESTQQTSSSESS